MPGFFLSNFKTQCQLNNIFNEKCIQNEIFSKEFVIKRNTLNKFMDDKLFVENDTHIIITEGVIFNKVDLMKEYQVTSFSELIIRLAEEDHDTFYKVFRGSFSGALYYKKEACWIIYTNHVGDNAIFYYWNDEKGQFIIGSQVNYLLEVFSEFDIKKTLNKKAVYFMLTYAFMADNATYANEISRLGPGQYISITKNNFEIKQYFKFKLGEYDLSKLSEDELIDEIDLRFRKAILYEYEKDKEYGYDHLGDLSAGTDARMNCWVANDMGYKDIINFTYSQYDAKEGIIAHEVAAALQNKWIFLHLDDAGFLTDVDEIVEMNYGLSLFSGITGGKRFFDLINFEHFGVEHTGQIGGPYVYNENDLKPVRLDGLYSKRFKDKLDIEHLNNFDDQETYLLTTRGFRGMLCTHLIRQNYCEVASPFIDIDLLRLLLSVPTKKRRYKGLLLQWMLKKYPEAAEIKLSSYETYKSKIKENDYIAKCKWIMGKLVSKGIEKIGIKKQKRNTMNPMDYWYSEKEEIRKYFSDYFKENIDNSIITTEIQNDLSFLFEKGNTLEKSQVLTVLSAVKYYFKN